MSAQPVPPRIIPVAPADLTVDPDLVATAFGGHGASVFAAAKPINIHYVLARHPLFAPLAVVLAGIANAELSARDREILILRVAWRTQSDYVWAWHHYIATEHVGMTDAEVAHLGNAEVGGSWSPSDAALIDAADELVPCAGRPIGITDSTWDHLAEHLTPEQLLEIPILVGMYVMVTGVAASARVEIDAQLEHPHAVPPCDRPGS